MQLDCRASTGWCWKAQASLWLFAFVGWPAGCCWWRCCAGRCVWQPHASALVALGQPVCATTLFVYKSAKSSTNPMDQRSIWASWWT